MKVVRQTILIDLKTDLGLLWSRIDKNLRTDVRKAKKSGVTLKISREQEDVGACFEIFLNLNKKYLTPVLKEHNFKLTDNSELLCAIYNNQIISFILVDLSNTAGKNNPRLKYAATNDAYKQLNPVSFLYWEAIARYKAQRYEFLDLGGSDYSTNDPQLIRLKEYKEKWNGIKQDCVSNESFPAWMYIRYLRKFLLLKKFKYFILTNFSNKYLKY